MAKFLPVFGEAVTLVESSVKLIGAGVTAPFNRKAAGKLLHSAGDAWVGYAQENALSCLVRGDGEGLKKGADGFSKGCPGVAHVRGAVHLVRGEKAEAYDCMANGTKAVAVIGVTVGVTIGTGGLGTGPALAAVGASAAGAQVALDAVDTGIRSAHDGKLVTTGTIRGMEQAVQTGDPVHIADAIVAPCQVAALAAGGAAVARAVGAGQAAAAQAENLAGTGQVLEGPAWQPNAALTSENLAALPKAPPRVPGANPAQSAQSAQSTVPSSAFYSLPSEIGTVISDISSISRISEYPASTVATVLEDAPVTVTEKRYEEAVRQLAPKDASGALPCKWSSANSVRFGKWLRQQIAESKPYDVIYQGVQGLGTIFRSPIAKTFVLAILVKGVKSGEWDFWAAFSLSEKELRQLMA